MCCAVVVASFFFGPLFNANHRIELTDHIFLVVVGVCFQARIESLVYISVFISFSCPVSKMWWLILVRAFTHKTQQNNSTNNNRNVANEIKPAKKEKHSNIIYNLNVTRMKLFKEKIEFSWPNRNFIMTILKWCARETWWYYGIFFLLFSCADRHCARYIVPHWPWTLVDHDARARAPSSAISAWAVEKWLMH